MPNPFSLFSRKKKKSRVRRPFNDYYADWLHTLNHKLLPLLRHSLSSSSPTLLSSRTDLLLHHILSYYHSLDHAATLRTIPHLLFPSWRHTTPYLFLGDLHPYLFTSLLRSFLDRSHHPAWQNPSRHLITRLDQIECGLRLMVPALTDRTRKAQERFVAAVVNPWIARQGKKMAVAEAMNEEMEEMVSVFLDANRLRRSVILEIIGAVSDYQAAVFLEGLARFLVGFGGDGDQGTALGSS